MTWCAKSAEFMSVAAICRLSKYAQGRINVNISPEHLSFHNSTCSLWRIICPNDCWYK